MKPQDLIKMKSSEATLSPYIASTLMVAERQRIGRRIMGHLHNKNNRTPPPTRDSINLAKGVDQRFGAAVVAEARTLLDLHTAYTTAMRQIIAPKIALFS
jgi:hypothetical protein